jgi:TrpR family trp operon transcriptional repressor
MPQREIAKNLEVSLCKITRGSRELKKPGSAFRRILDTLGFTGAVPSATSP